MDLCIECQANQASATSEECTVAWGVCNVRFKILLNMNSYLKYSVLDNRKFGYLVFSSYHTLEWIFSQKFPKLNCTQMRSCYYW